MEGNESSLQQALLAQSFLLTLKYSSSALHGFMLVIKLRCP